VIGVDLKGADRNPARGEPSDGGSRMDEVRRRFGFAPKWMRKT